VAFSDGAEGWDGSQRGAEQGDDRDAVESVGSGRNETWVGAWCMSASSDSQIRVAQSTLTPERIRVQRTQPLILLR
jgi:hypothetical protein